jgi:hypothetical protein
MESAQGKRTIQQLREGHKLRPAELVSRIGCDEAQLRHWERTHPPLHVLLKCADVFGIAAEEIALPDHIRLLNVRGHYFLIECQTSANEARVMGYGHPYAREWIQRPPDPEQPHAFSGSIFLFNSNYRKWVETGPTPKAAINRLSERIISAMERALTAERLPDDPPNWQPREAPHHWFEGIAYNERERTRRKLPTGI